MSLEIILPGQSDKDTCRTTPLTGGIYNMTHMNLYETERSSRAWRPGCGCQDGVAGEGVGVRGQHGHTSAVGC